MAKDKIRVLFVTCFGSLKGGGQRSLFLLIKHMDKSIFEPFLLVPESGELEDAVKPFGVRTFVLPFPRVRHFNIFSILGCLLKLRKIIKTEKIDLIYTDSDRETFYAGLAGRLVSVPVLLHLRVTTSRPWVDRCLYFLADRMIAVSNAAAHRFARIDKKNKIDVVYNGIELDVFKIVPIAALDRHLRIGYFGRLEPRKGLEVLIQALRLVNDPLLDGVIFGEGEPAYVRELIALAGDGRVFFKGFCPDILKVMPEIDAVVLPSHYGEGLSRSVIEALAMGKVAIVSDSPGNPEAVGEDLGEFIFRVNDVPGLARIFRHLLDNRDILAKAAPIARARAEKFFDIEKNTKAIEKIYEALAGKKI